MKLTPGPTLLTAYVRKEIPMLTNRLATVNKNGSNISFGYDGNGNACPPTGVITTIGTGYSITNTVYNWKNLPTAITKSGTTYNYRYDHHAGGRTSTGLRVYKQEGDNIHTLRGAFGEVLATYKNGSLDYWNIVRPDGTIIGRREGSNRLYYHRDHLGSTRAVVNASGSVVQTYDYYPFGLEIPGRSLTSGSTVRERFTGHERDDEVGLDYMQARRYAAEFGRFLSVDPLAGEYPSWSPYIYSLNNPLRFFDPTGLCPENPDTNSRNCVGGSTGFLAGFFNKLNTTIFDQQMPAWVGGLFVAQDAAESISADVKDAATDIARTGVGAGIIVADAVSDGSTIVAGAGVVAAPFTKGASLGVTGGALAVGTIADATSLSLKTLDYAAFGGSGEAVLLQGGATITRGFGGQLVKSASSRMVTRTGSAVTGTAFRSARTGQFVSNRYGYTVTAASDATRVVINVTIPNQPIRR